MMEFLCIFKHISYNEKCQTYHNLDIGLHVSRFYGRGWSSKLHRECRLASQYKPRNAPSHIHRGEWEIWLFPFLP